METKLGALWHPKEKSERGPIAKGSIDFSRIPDEEMKRIYEAFTAKGKVFITVWRNKHEDGDKKPDFSITMDKPWTPNQPSKPVDGFDDDIPGF